MNMLMHAQELQVDCEEDADSPGCLQPFLKQRIRVETHGKTCFCMQNVDSTCCSHTSGIESRLDSLGLPAWQDDGWQATADVTPSSHSITTPSSGIAC